MPVNPQRQAMENTSATLPPAPGRAGFSVWLKGDAGAVLAGYEREKLDRILPGLFGYHIVQIGQYDGVELASAGGIRNKIELRLDQDGLPDDRCALLAGAASLPFAAHSIDVVVMPHVLEYVPEPGPVLEEIERVLVEDGRLIVTGFSPWSLWGLCRLNPVWRKRPPWDGRFHGTARLRHWLSALHFEVLKADSFLFRPPCSRGKLMRRLLFLEKLGASCWPVLGAAYLVVAQKRRAPVSPVRLSWRKKILLSGASAGPATMAEAGNRGAANRGA